MPGRLYFVYDGISSLRYGLWVGKVNQSADSNLEMQQPYSYELDLSRTTHEARVVSRAYEETFQFEMEVVCDEEIPDYAEREILRWLTDSPVFKKLQFFNRGNGSTPYDQTYYNSILTAPERIDVAGNTVGWKFTVIADAPYAWTNEKTYQYNTSTANSFIVDNRSDEPYYTYPHVTINVGSTGGSLRLNNLTTGEQIAFNDVAANDVITVDSYMQITSEKNGNIYDSASGKIRLIQGRNQFQRTGDISSVVFSYRDARRVGFR